MLITEVEAANMLGMSISWMQRARVEGTGPNFVKFRHGVRYHPEEIEAFIEKCTQQSTSENRG